ncbi:hypothetical protein GE09DRAFT_1216815 [Coniochaeta sp. 2T2.1]|nr:hypothetical protein GE09DRAFT_1216815 [Coniochaeta sp. 2T2.1]
MQGSHQLGEQAPKQDDGDDVSQQGSADDNLARTPDDDDLGKLDAEGTRARDLCALRHAILDAQKPKGTQKAVIGTFAAAGAELPPGETRTDAAAELPIKADVAAESHTEETKTDVAAKAPIKGRKAKAAANPRTPEIRPGVRRSRKRGREDNLQEEEPEKDATEPKAPTRKRQAREVGSLGIPVPEPTKGKEPPDWEEPTVISDHFRLPRRCDLRRTLRA